MGPIFKGQSVQEEGQGTEAWNYTGKSMGRDRSPESAYLADRFAEVWRTRIGEFVFGLYDLNQLMPLNNPEY
jgi:hypothetical protein